MHLGQGDCGHGARVTYQTRDADRGRNVKVNSARLSVRAGFRMMYGRRGQFEKSLQD
jgi:hypothetical protein